MCRTYLQDITVPAVITNLVHQNTYVNLGSTVHLIHRVWHLVTKADFVVLHLCLLPVVNAMPATTVHFNQRAQDRRIVQLETFALSEVKSQHHVTPALIYPVKIT